MGNQINPLLGFCDAYTCLAPMIDTDIYIRWLMAEIQRLDCRIHTATIASPLDAQEASLLREYGVDAIVNCAGLGARASSGARSTEL